MRKLLLSSAAVAIVAMSCSSAGAADAGTSISIPIGDWLNGGASAAISVIEALVGLVLTRLLVILPAPVAGLVRTLHVEQILTRAIDYGINAVADAEKGKTLTVNVGNQVAAQALNYAISQGPGWLQSFVGGPDALAKMIVARLPLEASASAGVITSASPASVNPITGASIAAGT